ncbi:MAG TPA: amidohydrolase family protein [Pseudonocardia sp.]|nr:amidohydrolase family protein [Pseudonocardia sp.]
MALFDTVIKNGTVVDGMRMPRLRGDVGIKNGRVARIGRLDAGDADQVIDADDCIVAPGFVDLHTHYDAQIFWDPYCTISGWHGVTSVVIGNCGFGFAPVAPEMRERMMLSMTRVEAIPLAAMQAGLPWDWITYPEFLASLDRLPKGVNVLPYVPLGPLLVWVMGLEAAKSGRAATSEEMTQLKAMLNEAMDAGGCGWSAQRLPPYGGMANQRDFDGSPMPTDCMPDETALELARVLADRNEGFIQMTYVSGDAAHDMRHFEELAEVSGRPILYNAVIGHPSYPGRHKKQLKWLTSCRERGLSVYGQANSTAVPWFFALEDWNMFDDSEAWMEATTGSHDEKMHKLADPARRQGLRDGIKQIERGAVIRGFEHITPVKFTNPELAANYTEISLVDIAAAENKHVVDVMLDLATADNLETVFYAENATNSYDTLRDILLDPYTIPGVSDGGAHTKYLTAGRYPTETITTFVRDNPILSLEEAHWKLSALPAHCAGFKDRGTLREGAPADIIVYNLEELGMTESEVAHDFPGGEWRRVQRAVGYHAILVNGQQTFDHGKETGNLPGTLLRHGGTPAMGAG